MADFTDLDAAFTLPETVTDADLRSLFEVLVARCRAEASHLQMSTLQQLRIERIVTGYVRIKHAEKHPYGDKQGFQHPGQEKDANAAWQSIAKDFDDILAKSKPSDRAGIMAEVKELIVNVLSTVEDSGVRTGLMHRFVETFDRAGI